MTDLDYALLDEPQELRPRQRGPRCNCGAPLERSPANPRGRIGGDLLEHCACAARCGQTTTVLVESCSHGRAHPEPGTARWLCPDCGHHWAQLGEASAYELSARLTARRALGVAS